MSYEHLFGTRSFSLGQEEKLKNNTFNLSMNPREWMARFGHNAIAGDLRTFKYEDKKFEKWIYEAFEALSTEGLESLWKEFLTEEEIEEVKEELKNL